MKCLMPALIALATVMQSPSALTLEELRERRDQIARSGFGVIMNNDGNDMNRITEGTPEALIAERHAGHAGSQVGAIFYNSNSQFGIVRHFRTDRQIRISDGAKLLKEAGLDPIDIVLAFGKANDIRVFWSMRMNDIHDTYPNEKSVKTFEENEFKTANLDKLLGSPEDRQRLRGWSGVDYEHPEVREHALEQIREVLRNYAVEGVELDFWRFPYYFKPTLRGQPATEAQRELLTQFMREVRAMTEEEGIHLGRPIPIAIRVPDSVEYCRDTGIDIETWLDEGLADILVTASRAQLNPWEYSVELAKKYNVPFYACLENPTGVMRANGADGSSPPARLRRSVLGYRGRAMEALAAGADGIYTFNLWDSHHPLFREGASADTLLLRDKDYFASATGLGSPFGLPYAKYRNNPTLSPADPMALPPGAVSKVEVPMHDDIEKAKGLGHAPTFTLRIQLKEPDLESLGTIRFNDRPLAASDWKTEDGWFTAALPDSFLRVGRNELTFERPSGGGEAILTDVMMQVRYPTADQPKTDPENEVNESE